MSFILCGIHILTNVYVFFGLLNVFDHSLQWNAVWLKSIIKMGLQNRKKWQIYSREPSKKKHQTNITLGKRSKNGYTF